MNFWQLTIYSFENSWHIQFLKFTGWTILEFTGWTFFDNSRAEQYWNEGLNNIFTGCIFVWKFTDCFYIDGLNNLWNSRANSRAVYSRAAFKVGNSRANSRAVFTVGNSRANSRAVCSRAAFTGWAVHLLKIHGLVKFSVINQQRTEITLECKIAEFKQRKRLPI